VAVDAQTVLLLHCDGTNGSKVFPDGSPSAKTVTANGNAAISTAQSKFGGASALFDGTGDYLTVADSADWNFGTGPFTVECWCRLNAVNSGNIALIGQWATGVAADSSWFLYFNNSFLLFRIMQAGGSITDISVAATLGTSSWFHVAVDRDGSGTVRLYVNGTPYSPTAYTSALLDVPTPLSIGRISSSFTTHDLNGYLDEIRVSKGVARYAGAFTVQTAPFGAEPSRQRRRALGCRIGRFG